jgi:hypothetical protein
MPSRGAEGRWLLAHEALGRAEVGGVEHLLAGGDDVGSAPVVDVCLSQRHGSALY